MQMCQSSVSKPFPQVKKKTEDARAQLADGRTCPSAALIQRLVWLPRHVQPRGVTSSSLALPASGVQLGFLIALFLHLHFLLLSFPAAFTDRRGSRTKSAASPISRVLLLQLMTPAAVPREASRWTGAVREGGRTSPTTTGRRTKSGGGVQWLNRERTVTPERPLDR